MRLAASVLVSGDYDFRRSDLTTMDLGARAAQRAYEQAGVGPDDVNVVELHDAFASEEIIHAEDLGLCARGDGVGLLRSGPPRSVAASQSTPVAGFYRWAMRWRRPGSGS